MGLIRLLAYAMLGYVLYELFLGISEEGDGGGGSDRQRRSEESYRPMTGSSGEGMRVEATDAGGASVPHTVGRGVIS